MQCPCCYVGNINWLGIATAYTPIPFQLLSIVLICRPPPSSQHIRREGHYFGFSRPSFSLVVVGEFIGECNVPIPPCILLVSRRRHQPARPSHGIRRDPNVARQPAHFLPFKINVNVCPPLQFRVESSDNNNNHPPSLVLLLLRGIVPPTPTNTLQHLPYLLGVLRPTTPIIDDQDSPCP